MKIVCCGDSNTYGYDPRDFFGGRYEAQDRWVDRLGAALGCEMVNAGENGREIPRREAELRVTCDLIRSLQGDCVLVMLGTNDLLQGADANETARRMEQFLFRLQQLGVCPVLLTPPPMQVGEWTNDAALKGSRELAPLYAALAGRLRIPCFDAGKWDIPLCFDGVHFTESGHHRFAAELAEVLLLDLT